MEFTEGAKMEVPVRRFRGDRNKPVTSGLQRLGYAAFTGMINQGDGLLCKVMDENCILAGEAKLE